MSAAIAGSALPSPSPGAAAPAAAMPLVSDPASLVDPLIGTDAGVHDFPGADVPFGMVQWSPDTSSRPAGGGYKYSDTKVSGFSLTHVSGPGCGIAGDVPVLPLSGPVPADPAAAALPLDHAAEVAQAGYYRLTSDGITTGLTTTARTGMAIFDYPKGRPADLLLKLSGSQAGSLGSAVQVVSDREIAGSVTSGNFCRAHNRYTVHFDMVFNRAFTSHGSWTDGSGTNAGTGGIYLRFPTAQDATVQAKVGVSYVSIAEARANRLAEAPGWHFHAARMAAHSAWDRALGKIRVAGGTAQDRTLFYTALYHALLHPNVISDVDGRYPGFDGTTHVAPANTAEYSNDSGWDIYRTQAQLEAMVAPRRASQTARSMLDEYAQTGQLPKWEAYNSESYIMVGDPADSILADYYAFGARGFDYHRALSDMIAQADHANRVRPGLQTWVHDGYLPANTGYGCCNFYGSVATSQEYAVADSSIATLAQALHEPAVASRFAARANNWQTSFDPATGFLEPKTSDGRFLPGFAPDSTTGFVEADSYRYTPMEPQDLAGVIAAGGGRSAWISRLDQLTAHLASPGMRNADVGNEPSLEVPWEYDYAGAPWRTQQVVREIQQQVYATTPGGMAGNDDLGTLSSWFVWSALGLYPETPGSSNLALGSPLFARATVSLPSGRTLTIVGSGAAADAPYVQSLRVDGAPYDQAWVRGAMVRDGGTLRFTLSRTPDRAWATAASAAPPSDRRGLAPVLGFASAPSVATSPGGTASLRLGARSLGGARQISWTAHPGSSGASVSPSSGTFTVPAGGSVTVPVTLTAPPRTGTSVVSFSLSAGSGAAVPDVAVQLSAAPAGPLTPYFDNAGRSHDGTANAGHFDGDGWAYSAEQLAGDGWRPGASRTVDGLTYTFPNVSAGGLDNLVAAGQTVPLAGTSGATRLGVLGSAANAPRGSVGTFTVTYTDGSTSTMRLGLSDWTLGGGRERPVFGDSIAATDAYRDADDGSRLSSRTYLFAASGATAPGKRIRSVTMPSTVSAGQLHIFAIATG